jgi:lipoprotein NlpI
MSPSFAEVAVWSKGLALFSLGRFADAEAAFRRYLKARPDYSFGAVWLYLAETHAGKDGKKALADRVRMLDPNQWPAPILHFYVGSATRDEVLAAATRGDSFYLDQQACEAAFYMGEFYLISGKAEDAHRDLTQAATTCPKSAAERGAAQTELDRK